MCPSFPESNMLIFGIQHFRKLSTKKIIFFKKIHVFLPLANCVEIGSSFFLFIQYTKNLPLYLKQTPFIQKRLFILISLHHSSLFFFPICPILSTYTFVHCMFDHCVLSYHFDNFNNRNRNSIQNWIFRWSCMDISVLLVFDLKNIVANISSFPTLSCMYLGNLWDPLLGAQGTFSPFCLWSATVRAILKSRTMH